MLTHEHRARTAWLSYNYQDSIGPPGKPFRPLYDDQIHYSGQPIALVVAETFEAARAGAALVTATYKSEEHITDLEAVKGQSYVPPKRRSGIAPPPSPRGKADAAFERRRSRSSGSTASPSSTTTRWSRSPPRWCARTTAA